MGGGEEEFDVLDAKGRPTGRAKARSAVHRDGDWHAAVHVWVLLQCPCAGRAPPSAGAERLSDFAPAALLERALRGGGGGGKGGRGGFSGRCSACGRDWELLLQRRALHKESWPGMWDISAAGHVEAGGSALTTAQRELWEELGLRFPRDAFQPLFTHRQRFRGEFHGKSFVNNEFNHVFLVSVVSTEANKTPIPREALRLQEAEVAEVRSFPVAEIRERLLRRDPEYMTYLEGLSGESAGYDRLFQIVSRRLRLLSDGLTCPGLLREGQVRGAGGVLLPLRFYIWDYSRVLADTGDFFAFNAQDPPRGKARAPDRTAGEPEHWEKAGAQFA